MNINWDDEDLYKKVIDQVEEIGISRMTAQPSTMNEADFFAGAMAAMTALGMTPIQYPSSWTLGIMFGKPPLARRMENELQARDACRAVQDAQPEPGPETQKVQNGS
jgi:hypothetical protein